jgi:hypothetical protein
LRFHGGALARWIGEMAQDDEEEEKKRGMWLRWRETQERRCR